MVNKDQVKGVAKQAKGSVKEAAGKVTGNKRTEAEGKGEKAAGKVQKAYGDVKEKVKAAAMPPFSCAGLSRFGRPLRRRFRRGRDPKALPGPARSVRTRALSQE